LFVSVLFDWVMYKSDGVYSIVVRREADTLETIFRVYLMPVQYGKLGRYF